MTLIQQNDDNKELTLLVESISPNQSQVKNAPSNKLPH